MRIQKDVICIAIILWLMLICGLHWYSPPRLKSINISSNQQDAETESCILTTLDPHVGIPCQLNKDSIPMFIYITFDDAVHEERYNIYQQLFNKRRNHNGCPVQGTFFVANDAATNYTLVRALYDEGHEIASHGVHHSKPESTKEYWTNEHADHKRLIEEKTGIPQSEVIGVRAPYLSMGGDVQFQMMEDNGFQYDASRPNHNRSDIMWPFTWHDPGLYKEWCPSGPEKCPTKSYPTIWEFIMNGFICEVNDSMSIMADHPNCNIPDLYPYFMSNFKRYYDSNKAPFGISLHVDWLMGENRHRMESLVRFLDSVQYYKDVYIVSIRDMLSWIKAPRTIDKMVGFGCRSDK